MIKARTYLCSQNRIKLVSIYLPVQAFYFPFLLFNLAEFRWNVYKVFSIILSLGYIQEKINKIHSP